MEQNLQTDDKDRQEYPLMYTNDTHSLFIKTKEHKNKNI